jgi:hypothetical protein
VNSLWTLNALSNVENGHCLGMEFWMAWVDKGFSGGL